MPVALFKIRARLDVVCGTPNFWTLASMPVFLSHLPSSILHPYTPLEKTFLSHTVTDPHDFLLMNSLICTVSLLCNAYCHPLCTLYCESIWKTNCADCSLHPGSGLSASSLLIMHRVIRKLWIDRSTFRQTAGEQCSLNTPLCRQYAGKQWQRGGWTWGRGFHIAPCCLKAWWESSPTLALSLPLITATVWKCFIGNVQKLSVCSFLCVVCIHGATFWQTSDSKLAKNAQCETSKWVRHSWSFHFV